MVKISDLNQLRENLNDLGTKREAFLLMIDFELANYILSSVDNLDKNGIQVSFPTFQTQHNTFCEREDPEKFDLDLKFVSYEKYKRAFDAVQREIRQGNSYLLNLAFPTKIRNKIDLYEIYCKARAKYKILLKDQFTCFSPETFVQINHNTISTYPMKGTLQAHLPLDLLLDNPKELAEHATIVDLLRNDLSIIAKNVKVESFRYPELVETSFGKLWQTSSKITGELSSNYNKRLGNIIMGLLPAGSISGAPKKSTLEIIKAFESGNRGYYSGICFYWNGFELDSCVMIRFIQQLEDHFLYWSGGGITAQSQCEEEFEELKNKVYLPFKTSTSVST